MTFSSEILPADHKAAIRQLKRELRAQIGDVQGVFNKLSDKIATRVAEINALKSQCESVWPVIPFEDVKNGNITAAQREAVKRRGCAVIKGHFPRGKAGRGVRYLHHSVFHPAPGDDPGLPAYK